MFVMARGKITPNNILHFNRKSVVDEEDAFVRDITVDNIIDVASSDNVSDAMKNLLGRSGLLRGVKAVNPVCKVAGFVRTVETSSYDWGTGIKGIYACSEGEILVIKCSNNDYAIWGGLASCSAQVHGVGATVIIGSSRDTEDILSMGYPVFSQDIKSCAGLPSNEGVIGENLIVDDMVISDGDFAVCDVDGVVIVPREHLDEVIDEVNNIKNFESSCFKKITEDNQRLDDLVGF